MLSALQRINTHPVKATVAFNIVSINFPSTVGLELNPDGTYMSVLFQRHNGAVVQTSGKRVHGLSNGAVIVDIEEKLSHIVTLYRDPSGKYQEKKAKLIVRTRVKSGNTEDCFKRIGIVNLDLNTLALVENSQTLSFPIIQSTAKGGEIRTVVTVSINDVALGNASSRNPSPTSKGTVVGSGSAKLLSNNTSTSSHGNNGIGVAGGGAVRTTSPTNRLTDGHTGQRSLPIAPLTAAALNSRSNSQDDWDIPTPPDYHPAPPNPNYHSSGGVGFVTKDFPSSSLIHSSQNAHNKISLSQSAKAKIAAIPAFQHANKNNKHRIGHKVDPFPSMDVFSDALVPFGHSGDPFRQFEQNSNGQKASRQGFDVDPFPSTFSIDAVDDPFASTAVTAFSGNEVGPKPDRRAVTVHKATPHSKKRGHLCGDTPIGVSQALERRNDFGDSPSNSPSGSEFLPIQYIKADVSVINHPNDGDQGAHGAPPLPIHAQRTVSGHQQSSSTGGSNSQYSPRYVAQLEAHVADLIAELEVAKARELRVR